MMTNDNNGPMIMAPETENTAENNPTTPWGQYAAEKQAAEQQTAEQQTAEDTSVHDTMVKIIDYMNKINGEGKTIDAEAVTQQLMEKFSDKALELLTMAVNEPSNFASYIDSPEIKTSRGAVNALCNLSEQQTDKILSNQDNTNDESMIFAQKPYDIAKKIYATTSWGQYAAEKQKQATAQQTAEANTNNEPMIMAPKPDNTVERIAASTPWGQHAAEKQKQATAQQTAEANSSHDKMVKIINYMNSINGEGKTIDAEAVTQQLLKKFPDKALDLLTMAVNEPKNFASYIGDSSIKTSRGAISALCNISEQQADKALLRKEIDLKSVLKTQSDINKTLKESQKTIERIKKTKPAFNVQNPLDNAIKNNQQQRAAETDNLKNGGVKLRLPTKTSQEKLEKALAKNSTQQNNVTDSKSNSNNEPCIYRPKEDVNNINLQDSLTPPSFAAWKKSKQQSR